MFSGDLFVTKRILVQATIRKNNKPAKDGNILDLFVFI